MPVPEAVMPVYALTDWVKRSIVRAALVGDKHKPVLPPRPQQPAPGRVRSRHERHRRAANRVGPKRHHADAMA